MQFVKAESKNLRELVLDQMLDFISAQDATAETRLPTETDLAEQFGVSRTVIRETMQSLQAKGIIRIEQGRGTFIARHPFAQPFSVWASLNAHRVEELFEVRILLEGDTAFRAARKVGDDDLRQLAQLNAKMLGAAMCQRWDDAMESDREFHRMISELSGLRLLQEMLEVAIPTWMRINARFSRGTDKERRIDMVHAEHEAVLSALGTRDPEAARAAMQAHLRGSLARRLAQEVEGRPAGRP